MYNEIKETETRKIRDLRMWVQDIQYSISNIRDIAKRPISEKNTEKGLFFVYAYGIIEDTVRNVVLETIQHLNNAQIDINSVSYPLYALVFDREFEALSNVGASKKWEKRWMISDRIIANEKVVISKDIMPTDGKNIRYKQLESIAKSFGISLPVIPSPEIGGHLETIVNNRNWIAHGDKSPVDIGRQYTINEIINYTEITSELCTYIIELYESYIINSQFVK